MANEFKVNRTAVASFTIPNGSASTQVSSGVIIPAGAIVTGIRILANEAVTTTGASATVAPILGTTPLAATARVSALPAVSVPGVTALATTAGIYVDDDYELKLNAQASSNAAATATYDYYVDYIYAN